MITFVLCHFDQINKLIFISENELNQFFWKTVILFLFCVDIMYTVAAPGIFLKVGQVWTVRQAKELVKIGELRAGVELKYWGRPKNSREIFR